VTKKSTRKAAAKKAAPQQRPKIVPAPKPKEEPARPTGPITQDEIRNLFGDNILPNAAMLVMTAGDMPVGELRDKLYAMRPRGILLFDVLHQIFKQTTTREATPEEFNAMKSAYAFGKQQEALEAATRVGGG
jgi:hypothetical protein